MRATLWIPALLFLLAACSGGERWTGESAAEAVDSAALAAAQFDAAAFDTIEWKDQAARLERGEVVWRFSCSKCHAADGSGGGDVADALGLDVPSLLRSGRTAADDSATIQREIYVGTNEGMPNWGLHGLKLRDIDAVTAYIVDVLRAKAKR